MGRSNRSLHWSEVSTAHLQEEGVSMQRMFHNLAIKLRPKMHFMQ